jgi:hypothetical protein
MEATEEDVRAFAEALDKSFALMYDLAELDLLGATAASGLALITLDYNVALTRIGTPLAEELRTEILAKYVQRKNEFYAKRANLGDDVLSEIEKFANGEVNDN